MFPEGKPLSESSKACSVPSIPSIILGGCPRSASLREIRDVIGPESTTPFSFKYKRYALEHR